jgi:hypothetical protein
MGAVEQSQLSSADIDKQTGTFAPDVSGYYELTAVTSTMRKQDTGLEGCRRLVRQVRAMRREKKQLQITMGFRVGDRSRGRFALHRIVACTHTYTHGQSHITHCHL